MALRLKSPRDIQQMRRAGELLHAILDEAMAWLHPGLTTQEVASAIDASICAAGAEPVMRSAGFPAAAAICINEEAVHALPGVRRIRDGDLVTVDAALRFQGWCVDSARCTVVGAPQPDGVTAAAARTAAAAAQVAAGAIAAIAPGRSWSQVVAAAHAEAIRIGVAILPFEGHGIGSDLHESPAAGFAGFLPPGSGNRTPGGQDFILRPGLVLTIEPVVTFGRQGIRALDDGWTVVTLDRAPAAHHEYTVAVTRGGPMILTAPQGVPSPVCPSRTTSLRSTPS